MEGQQTRQDALRGAKLRSVPRAAAVTADDDGKGKFCLLAPAPLRRFAGGISLEAAFIFFSSDFAGMETGLERAHDLLKATRQETELGPNPYSDTPDILCHGLQFR